MKRILIPIGIAVLTWLVALLAIGFLAELRSLSVFTLIPAGLIGALLIPIISLSPWRDGISDRVMIWLRTNGHELALVPALLVLTVIPITPDLVVTVLELPYRASGIFFGASLFYRDQFGPLVGQAVLRFGQWYLEVIWVFMVGKGLLSLTGWVR